MGTSRKVALVTGGSRGIGQGVAKELALTGFDLAINGRRPESDVLSQISDLKSAAHVLYFSGDVANLSDHTKMLDAIRGRFGRLDVLVNNAGVAPQVRADILDATPESFDRLMSINLGPYFLPRQLPTG